jgi:two-component system nitrogen regulation sensor histidine kinase NtrY
VAQAYYRNASENALVHARQLAGRVREDALLVPGGKDRLQAFVTDKQREYNVGTVQVFDIDREVRAMARADAVPGESTLPPSAPLLTAALEGRPETRIQSMGRGDVIRAAVPILGASGVEGAVVVEYFVPESVATRSADIARSFQEYRQLKILKQPITSNYIVTLVLVTLLVIFCATWMGFYLAKGITVPIQKLAEGTREVAQGNWQYRIGLGDATQVAPDDEFGTLVASFNQMTGRPRDQQPRARAAPPHDGDDSRRADGRRRRGRPGRPRHDAEPSGRASPRDRAGDGDRTRLHGGLRPRGSWHRPVK